VNDELSTIATRIVGRFDALSHVRDDALAECRQLVRIAANAIRALPPG
jgi:hypothetical protein